MKETKTIHFGLPKDGNKSDLKHELYFITDAMSNGSKSIIFCPNRSIATISMNTDNCRTYQPHNFVFNLSQRLDLRGSSKHLSL